MRFFSVLSLVQIFLLLCVSATWNYVDGQGIVSPDSLKNVAKDSLKGGPDTTVTIDLEKMKRESDLKTKIDYQSENYMILDLGSKNLKLIQAGKVNYEDMSLAADTVSLNWETNLVTAKGKEDSTGQMSGRPEFTENDQTYKADSMTYNIKTQKGLVFGARTKQDENYILADRVKKMDGETYYIEDGKFTTCDHEHPHYYIKSKKLKVIPRDKIITGPLMLVLEDFPLPIIIPFGFFPNQTGKKSGILMPTYGEAPDRGFFLRDLGYYFAISDQFDFRVQGDIFTKGGWRIEAGTQYNKRYRYDGNFTAQYGYQKFGEKGDPNFRDNTDFWVQWSHNQKINPQASFTANVNAGTSSFNNNFSYNEQNFLSSNFKSAIYYNQSIANSSWRFNANLDLNQNTATETITLGAPNVTVNRTRWFPFKTKTSTGDKWYQKIGMTYTMNMRNSITAPDSLFDDIIFNPTGDIELVNLIESDSTSTLDTTRVPAQDYFRNGIQHSIPINTQLNLARHINITPQANYREYWYIRTLERRWENDSLITDDVYGFATARDFNVNVNASTRIYGIFQFDKLFKFWKNPREAAVRHTITPSIGYSYKPDFSTPDWGYFRTVQVDTLGNTETYSRFQNGIFGGPSAGETQAMTFNINNIFELKYKPKVEEGDTTQIDAKDPWKRMNILDQLGASGSYNFAADSLNLSLINFNARTNILNNRFGIQLNGTFDPYDVLDSTATRINTFLWDSDRKLARLSSIRLALNTRFESKRRVGQSVTSNNPGEKPDNLTDAEWDHIRYYRDAYIDFAIPWSINLIGNLQFTNNGLNRDTTLTLNFNGDFNLTPKWKVGFTSGYDFKQNDFSYTSVSIYRDLHCWEMSMTWIPFGQRTSYNFSINVKSSTLRDLKLTKRRDWQDRF